MDLCKQHAGHKSFEICQNDISQKRARIILLSCYRCNAHLHNMPIIYANGSGCILKHVFVRIEIGLNDHLMCFACTNMI